jgi:hypothetical protein
MIRLFITPPIRRQVLPKHSIPRNGLECNTHLCSSSLVTSNFVTLQNLTPSSLLHIRHPDPWELGPSTFTFCVNVYHERAHSIGFSASSTPVVVMLVMASYSISLSSQTFDMKVWIPSLEISRSMLNTPDNIITVYDSDFRETDLFLDGRLGSGRDRRGLKLVFTVMKSVTCLISGCSVWDGAMGT